MALQTTAFAQVLIIGCGDIGLRVARLWQAQAATVSGVARSAEGQKRLQQVGVAPIQADLSVPASLTSLPLKEALVYYFAPPPAKGTQDTHMQNFLAAIPTNQLPARIVAISTSGIYGDQQGKLVTEQTPANPQVDRAHRRWDAEQQLRAWSGKTGVPVVILRVGGIYGPGRLPLERIKKAVPMLHEHLAPQTNRIHADDLAQVCVNAALYGRAGEAYNVSDGQDSNMTEYFLTIADHFGLPHPPLVDWAEAEQTISEGMLSYLRESRRMDNSKMLKELRVTLKYPDLKSGLEHC